jgi:MFS family permease
MEQPAKKLWNRDFLLLVFGQIISIFGNMVLSFALPLYILDISGSAAMYGLILALPYISLIIVSPIGGIIADRLRKQRIMFWLDATTTVIIVLYMVASGIFTALVVPLVIVKLMALNAIQGLYMPAVQASIPALAPADKLVPANSVISMINMFSSMAGMAIAGILYDRFGLLPILTVSAVCFAVTAVMDLLIRIPYKKQESSGSLAHIVKSDISLSVIFMVKEKPILAKSAIIVFFLQLTLVSMIIVGVPVLITQNLEFGMDLVGISSSIMMVGGLVGSIAAGALGARLGTGKIPLLLAIGAMLVVPIGLVFLIDMPAFTAYVIITASTALMLCAVQMASIHFFVFVQRAVPTELIGKIMSLIVILPFIANGAGSFAYGLLFEQFEALPWIIVFGTVVASAMVALYAHSQFRDIPEGEI